jgi:hypothetical protein
VFRTVIVVTLLVFSVVAPRDAAAQTGTEQGWILSSVTTALEGMSGKTLLPSPSVDDHVWSPATYRAAAEAAFAAVRADEDLNVRTPLVTLTSEELVAQNTRVSLVLEADMRKPAAHEAAALLVGAFALREASAWFHDVRPSLSRMAAHLAAARALRRPSLDETLDGALARTVLTMLVGRQREAMAMLDGIESKSKNDADRAWVRALRLRITGDWRTGSPDGAPLLVRLEHGRAIRDRLGIDAYLDYLDKQADGGQAVDWNRVSFDGVALNIEAGHRTEDQIKDELAETLTIWMAVHNLTEVPDASALMQWLDARPAASPVTRTGGSVKVRVLDWGLWAAHQQRHLLHAFIARASFADLFGDEELRATLFESVDENLSGLRLSPIALRWMAETPQQYKLALERARPLARETPELIAQRGWTLLLQTPDFADRAAAFPLDQSWFTPAVPVGTAFELEDRALRPGCPRPPTRQQAADWARERPYDHWTQWGDQWLGVDGKPTLAAVRKAFGPLVEYDADAIRKLLDHMNLPPQEWLSTARSLCDLVGGTCDELGEKLLLAGQTAQAAQVYDKWADGSRDQIGVANGMTWIFRYHLANGRTARAEALARVAEDAGSHRGLLVAAEWHERQGRADRAEEILQALDERYDDSTPLGTFFMRRALVANDQALQAKAAELMRDEYPLGPEPLVTHALPATAGDGVRFRMFGTRMESLGFEPADIIVGVDGWRVHDVDQYQVAIRFSYDENVTFTIFRKGKYQPLKIRVPERWVGTRFADVAR